MTTPDRQLTGALLSALDAVIATGDGGKPAAGGWQGTPGQSSYVPYVVLHCMVGGFTTGSIDDNDSSEIPFQVSCYGATREQCQFAAEKIHDPMMSARPALTAHAVVWVDDDMGGGSRRVDEVQPPHWLAVPRYRFYLSPKS